MQHGIRYRTLPFTHLTDSLIRTIFRNLRRISWHFFASRCYLFSKCNQLFLWALRLTFFGISGSEEKLWKDKQKRSFTSQKQLLSLALLTADCRRQYYGHCGLKNFYGMGHHNFLTDERGFMGFSHFPKKCRYWKTSSLIWFLKQNVQILVGI